VLAVNAGASQLDDFGAMRFERLEIEFLGTVIAQFGGGIHAGLQTVCPDNLTGRQMLDEEMIAHGVERFGVQSAGVGFLQTLIEFDVENFKAQGLRGADFIGMARQARGVIGRRTDDESDGFGHDVHRLMV